MIFDFGQKGIRRFLLVALTVLLLISVITAFVISAQTTRRGRVTDDVDPGALRVRTIAGTSGNIAFRLSGGDEVLILGEEQGQEVNAGNSLWYYIEYNGAKGYAYSAFISVIPDVTIPPETSGDSDTTTGEDGQPSEPTEPVDFEAYLNEQGFPESYKPALRELHTLYPTWIFKAQHVNYDFYDAVQKETEENRSLVWVGSISSWKSIEGDSYDWASNTWKGFDGPNWVRASKDIIAHYMDPRNFLGTNSVFQFLEQSYDGNIQNLEGVQKIIAGTFMERDVIDADGTTLNYANAIYNAGREYGVNPYVLAAMLVQEQGVNGTSGLISGTYPGYEGYFNYFNIGAYATDSMNAIQRGLWYAKGGNTGGTSNLRPWTTRLKAINGGAYYYANGYTNVGQNTLYLKRFNVQGSAPFTHQYMTNIQGAASEAGELAQGYSAELRKASLSFYIPVYKNMPETAVLRPVGDGSPNMKLSSLSVSGYELTPDFDPDVLEYMLVVPPSFSSVTINATAMEASATISGAGTHNLTEEKHVFQIKVTAGNGAERVYTLTVAKENSESFGKVSFTEAYKFRDNMIYCIAPGTTVAQLRANLMAQGNLSVKSASGAAKGENDHIASNDIISIVSTNNMPYGEYRASVLGEVNCDGKITVTDLMRVRNLILNSGDLTALELLSADIDGSGKININDLIKIRNHILGTASLS